MTLSAFIDLALALPETEESLYYGGPSIKRKGKIMFSYGREEGEVVSIKLDWESKLRLLVESPEAFWVTPHLSTWPFVFVKVSELSKEQAEELVQLCWKDAPRKSVVRKEFRIEG